MTHAVSDQVFDGNDTEQSCIADRTNEADMGSIHIAVHRHIGDNLKAQLEIGMYPAARQLTRTGWPDEADALHLLFQFRLANNAYVEVAGCECAGGIEFSSRTADKDGTRETASGHGVADAGEQAEGGDELGAIARQVRCGFCVCR